MTERSRPTPPGGLPPGFNLHRHISEATSNISEGEMPRAVAAAKELFDERQKLEYQATHDELTGLLNRTAWRQKLEAAIERGGNLAVIYVDLTNLKRVNDEHPLKHVAGDRVLQEVSGVVRVFTHIVEDSVRHEAPEAVDHLFHQPLITLKNDTTGPGDQMDEPELDGRLGGDEIGILLDLSSRDDPNRIMGPEELNERLGVVINRLKGSFQDVHSANPTLRSQYGFDVAVGGAVWQPGMTSGELLTLADENMGLDKQAQHESNGKYR